MVVVMTTVVVVVMTAGLAVGSFGVRRAEATAPEPDKLARGSLASGGTAGAAAAAATAAAAEVWHHSYRFRIRPK